MPAIRKRSKRYKAAAAKAVPAAVPVAGAIEIVKAFQAPKFDQSVELIFNLGIDAKQADQAVRTSISLPNGIGKTNRVICFCPEEKTGAAVNAGAIKAGGEELVKEIESSNFTDFDVAIADPSMMRFVSRLGKVLGPKGLMPSPKAGTVTPNVAEAVKDFVAGKTEVRNDSGGNLHTVVGKMSFSSDKLQENIEAMLAAVNRLKPANSKGVYLKKAVLKGSMTPAVELSL